jgi:glycosyltransferase involved in cell wall biosynthesis
MSRILFFQTNNGRRNGISAYIRELTCRLQGTYDCHCLAFEHEEERAALARYYDVPAANIVLLRPGSERALGWRQMSWLAAEVRRREIDLVHTHALRAAVLVAALKVIWRSRVASVYTNHGLRYRQPTAAWKRALAFCAEAVVSRVHQSIVCITEQDWLAARASCVSPADRLRVVRTRLNVCVPEDVSPGSAFEVVCVGPVGLEKGSDRFIQIARKARAQLPGLRFSWIGGEVPAKKAAVEVEWLGSIEREQVLRRLAGASLYLFCSRIDTYPLTILEAYACGLPVVFLTDCDHAAYTATGMPRFAGAQVDEAAAAVVSLTQDPVERGRLSDTARRWFADNAAGADRWVAEYRSVYEASVSSQR